MDNEATESHAAAVIGRLNTTCFREIQLALRNERDHRLLSSRERKAITAAISTENVRSALLARNANMHGTNFHILMAFTKDYIIGHICKFVNHAYAKQHGYLFSSDVLPYEDMLETISPRTHCTWYKVLMILRILEDTAHTQSNNIGYLVWIDADAVVLNGNVSLEQIVSKGNNRDLIISEDMNCGCLVNAGILIIRVSEWSKLFWREVWACQRYNDVFFYEQSAIMRCLKQRHEGLDRVPPPFHSYLAGGSKEVKLFAHVAVLPHTSLNTNCGVSRQAMTKMMNSETAVCHPDEGDALTQDNDNGGVKTCGGDQVHESIISPMDEQGTQPQLHTHAGSGHKQSLWAAQQQQLSQCEHVDSSCGSDAGATSISTLQLTRDLISRVEAQNIPDFTALPEFEGIIHPTELEMNSLLTDNCEDTDIDSAALVALPEFIFHAAGLADKLTAIRHMLALFQVRVPPVVYQEIQSFQLFRGKKGGKPSTTGSIVVTQGNSNR